MEKINNIIPSNFSDEYRSWFVGLKQKIRQSQIKASIKVNTELLKLYWRMGKEISEKRMDSKWGTGFFDKLSQDLKREFPDMSGFSATNIKYMKRFYIFYNQYDIIRQQLVDELESNILRYLGDIVFILFQSAGLLMKRCFM